MEKRKRTGLLSLLCGLLLMAPQAFAGWELVDGDGARTYISDGRLKEFPAEGESVWTVQDLKRGKVLIVNVEKRLYAEISTGEFCSMMKEITGEIVQAPRSKPKVRVEKNGQETISGLPAERYKIYLNGALHEEIWLTKAPALLKELGTMENRKTAASCSVLESDPELDPAYLKLISEGWVLKSIDAEGEINTTKVGKKEIPESEFQPPKGYVRGSLGKAMGMGIN